MSAEKAAAKAKKSPAKGDAKAEKKPAAPKASKAAAAPKKAATKKAAPKKAAPKTEKAAAAKPEKAAPRERKPALVGRTVMGNAQTAPHAWWVVDAADQIVGRLSSQVVTLIRGKHKPIYTPHADCGDFVVIVNAEKVRFTGAKETDKLYYRHKDKKPGSLKAITPEHYRATQPEFILRNAIEHMLPKTRLGRALATKVKIYAGPDHPHAAQQPREFKLAA